VDIAGFFATVNLVDLLIFVYLFGWFVLGYAQGAIRRIVGILTISFSFFLAAQFSVPLGSWLASHWRQFPPGYAEMIGFGALFVAGFIAFALIVQGTYTRVAVFAAHPIIDEILGGILGVIEGGLLLMFVVIILDGYFLTASSTADSAEIPLFRGIWTAINGSWTGAQLHQAIIPAFVTLTGFLLPAGLRAAYGR
jgi:uncharacterized membrane protein required for colicin V production